MKEGGRKEGGIIKGDRGLRMEREQEVMNERKTVSRDVGREGVD